MLLVIVISGGPFDDRCPEPADAAARRETRRRVRQRGVPVFVIPGNHDSITVRPNLYNRHVWEDVPYRVEADALGLALAVDTNPLIVRLVDLSQDQ